MILPDRSEIDVVFATPSTSLMFCAEGRNAMIAADRLLISRGYHPDYLCVGGDIYLSKVRSKIATVFLEDYKAEHLFFLDDDVGFDFRKPLQYLEHEGDVVSGIYPKKADQLEFPMILAGKAGQKEPIVENGFVLATMVPSGFTRIRRRVLERMAADSATFSDTDLTSRKMRKYLEIFRMGLADDGVWYGEDVEFCNRCLQMGFTMWADIDHAMTHRGNKVWSANLGGFIKSLDSQTKAAIEMGASA